MPINPEDLLARLQLNDDDLRDIETTFKDGKEDLSECVICKEDIFDILREAEKDNKGGMEGSLSFICISFKTIQSNWSKKKQYNTRLLDY
ncbi:hypothetical protein I204_05728 [Kwoniella mangroviensis CBS 8886]|nr:hypothetical protein I204_05728 [Kwoniella mangroviensis CBS 8886]